MAKRRNVLMPPLFITGAIIILFVIVIRFPISIRLKEVNVCETEKPPAVAYWNVIYQDSSIEFFEKEYNIKLDFLSDIDFAKETVIFSCRISPLATARKSLPGWRNIGYCAALKCDI